MYSTVKRFQVFLPMLAATAGLAACGDGSSLANPASRSATSGSGSGSELGSGAGADSDGGSGGSSGSDAPTTPASAACSTLFTQRVEPRLSFCRPCHTPTGVAKTTGARFMLTSDPSQDYQSLVASWVRLGKNDGGTSLLLSMPSGTSGLTHDGGKPWPVGSDAYNDASSLVQSFDDPSAACKASGTGTVTEDAVLGSKRGGQYWDDFCMGKSDDTPLPPDPRTLVVPGVNQNKAVYMNAYWQTCQKDDQPATCGDLNARIQRGYNLVAANGTVGAGSVFAGDGSIDSSELFSFSASQYASLAQALNIPADQFDQLIAERWGSPLAPNDGNPYPKNGEDPNKTNGGSGRLPMSLTQLRRQDGTWTGNISITCSVCHAGKVGDATDGPGLGPMYGTNSLSDMAFMFSDIGKIPGGGVSGALGFFQLNHVRGTGNITNFQFFGFLEIAGNIGETGAVASIQNQPSTGTEDPPVWWNLGHRTHKFFDGAQVADAKRIELSFDLPNFPVQGIVPGSRWGDSTKWITDHQQDADAWIESLRSPQWPESKLGAIDTTLAQEGGVLFHNKNLWAPALNNPVPAPPGGNGSCASCHGVYSPRYVNDSSFLDNPLFEGIAANIVPANVIGTDRARLDGNSQTVVDASAGAWFAYSDGPNDSAGNHLCGNWNDPKLRGDRALGYLAPPLYGVWATAPYFHNGSVPNLWEVLKPSDRQQIWRRVSTTPPPGQTGLVMGFASDLGSYDAQKVGWKYDTLDCGSAAPLDCTNNADAGLAPNDIGLAWNFSVPTPTTTQQIEDRKVYNTTYYSQSNAGHEFAAVLTDDERKAIIEYLKTL